jgi:hypothetical protein
MGKSLITYSLLTCFRAVKYIKCFLHLQKRSNVHNTTVQCTLQCRQLFGAVAGSRQKIYSVPSGVVPSINRKTNKK